MVLRDHSLEEPSDTHRDPAVRANEQAVGARQPDSDATESALVPQSQPADPAAPAPRRWRVVILGGGFGGAYCAERLEKLLRHDARDVLLINAQNYFVFYPLLTEAGTGALEPRHTVVPLRKFLRRAHFRMAEVVGVDFHRQTVRLRLPGGEEDEAGYEHLVLALGSVTRLPDVPGLRENGYELKSIVDAIALRDRAIQMLERADATSFPHLRPMMLRFVVVGANFTGTELAGELQALLDSAARNYPNVRRGDWGVTLVERNTRILGALPEDLADYAARTMERRGVHILLSRSVNEVAVDHVELDNGEVVPTLTTIWCAGIAPPPLVSALHVPTDAHGYVLCDADLRVQGYTNVWAIGDLAVNRDPQGRAYPATAQHATREGGHCARNIVAAMRGKPTTPFVYASRGSLAALGCRTGVAKVFGVKLSGLPAWVLWRTVYLMKMPGWGRKLRVALDWTLDWFFERDYVQLGIHEVVRPKPASRPEREVVNEPHA